MISPALLCLDNGMVPLPKSADAINQCTITLQFSGFRTITKLAQAVLELQAFYGASEDGQIVVRDDETRCILPDGSLQPIEPGSRIWAVVQDAARPREMAHCSLIVGWAPDALTVTAWPKKAQGYAEKMLRHLRALAESGDALDEVELRNLRSKCGPERTVTGSVIDLISNAVSASPESIAVDAENAIWSYTELWQKAGALAQVLMAQGVGRDSIVPVFMPRSSHLCCALLAVMRAGGAYFPIDPDYPEARIKQYLAVAPIGPIVTLRAHRFKLDGADHRAICADDKWDQREHASPWPDPQQDDLSFVIHSSGSTGRPKCILQTHRCLANFVGWQAADSGLSHAARVLQTAPPGFDISVQEICFTLASGGTLVVVPERIRTDPALLGQLIEEKRPEIVDLPFSLLSILANDDARPLENVCLKHIISAGEPLHLTPELTKLLHDRPDIVLHNHYGPAETHMLAAYGMQAGKGTITPRTPVGHLIWNVRAYILDGDYQFVAEGAEGELYISGPGLARGYLDPRLTAESYLPNPFVPSARMYKTGDRARWLENGAIELLGRKDEQVKIRGNRVELTDVEEALLRHLGLVEAAVVAVPIPDGSNELCAFVVGPAAEQAAELRAHIIGLCPQFMVPSQIEPRDCLPKAPNGKIDKLQLAREAKQLRPNRPQNGRGVPGMFAQVLGAANVDHDARFFFDLGGDSLKAMRLAALVRKYFGVALPVADIYAYDTVAKLQAHIPSLPHLSDRNGDAPPSGKLSGFSPAIEFGSDAGMPMTDAQRRFWLLSHVDPAASVAYGINLVYRWNGEWNADALREAAQRTANDYPVLSSSFLEVGAKALMRFGGAPVPFEVMNCKDVEEAFETLQALPIDLETGPMFSVHFLEDHAEKRLVLKTHHIISDAGSVSVLEHHFFDHYSALCGTAKGPEKPDQNMARVAVENCNRGDALRYWADVLADPPDPLDLPCDASRSGVRQWLGARREATMLSSEVLKLAQRFGTSPFSVLCAAVAQVLCDITGQDDLVVGYPATSRDRVEMDDQIGLFIRSLPLRLKLNALEDLEVVAKTAHTSVRDALDHASVDMSELVELPGWTQEAGRTPLFDVWVVLERQSEVIFSKALLGAQIERLDPEPQTAIFDLSFQFCILGDRLRCRLQYDRALYAADTIDFILASVCDLLAGAAGTEALENKRIVHAK